MYNTIIISIDELWLKGKNRPFYFKTLKKNIKLLLRSIGQNNTSVSIENHRFVVNSEEPFSEDNINAISNIPGTNSIIPAFRIEKSYEAIFPAVEDEIKRADLSEVQNFRIYTKRVDKLFPMKSMDISRDIGALVIEKFPELKAKMVKPDLQVEIRILRDFIYISSGKIPAPGGLPVGTNGHLITMLSGGIDSPVASYLMSKRGCKQTFMFFYAYPMVGAEVMDKIEKLISILGKYQSGCRLYVIKFGDFQKKLVKLCKNEYRTVLFRKYMMECGSILAQKIDGQALLTGDSLGQVSSQTLTNISEIDHFTDLTIFRPLVGLNKIEIIETAKKIGTFKISVIPYDDACSMLAPRHPVLRSERNYLEKFINGNDFSAELKDLVLNAEIIEIDPSGELTRPE
ncbi:MAG: tRNA uracil 4-sulfurtransferase ThiI [Acidobacteriota bacterium]